MRSLFGPSKPQETAKSSSPARGKPKSTAKKRSLGIDEIGQVSMFPSQSSGNNEEQAGREGRQAVPAQADEEAVPHAAGPGY